MIAEPAVTLTDFGLALECGLFAMLLMRGGVQGSALRNWFVIFFVALGAGSLFGAMAHGFPFILGQTGADIVWLSTMLSIGVVGFALWAIAAQIGFKPATVRLITAGAAIALAAYALIVLFIDDSFWIAIAFYIPASIFLLIVLVYRYLRTSDRYLILGMMGVLLTFVAAVIQQTGIAIQSVYLDRNALYHIVQAIALLLFFLTARRLVALPRPSER